MLKIDTGYDYTNKLGADSSNSFVNLLFVKTFHFDEVYKY